MDSQYLRNEPVTASYRHQTPFEPEPQSTVSITKMLTELTKLYNDEKKYGGELYDTLNAKLKIFYDNCSKIGLMSNQLRNAFSIMLKE